ncbi:MAG TPA: hypothetical protein VF574_09285 [Allosphingosinicella sp.]
MPIGADPAGCIRRSVELLPGEKAWTIEPMNIPPGRYFPRMARPHHQHPGDFPTPFAKGPDFATLCFQIVGPSEPNFGVFGGEFRNILLLEATEI